MLRQVENESNLWVMAGAAAGAFVVSGSLTWAVCEEEPQHHHQQTAPGSPLMVNRNGRRVTTRGVADPMTSYGVYAEKRQSEEKSDESESNSESATVQATTSRKKEEATSTSTGNEAVQATSADEVAVMAGRLPTDPITPSEQILEEATRKAKQHSGGLKIFTGNGNMSLALEIARHLGINIGKATVGRFADGEVNVVINENVRGKDVYIIQPTCPPVNDNIMELLLMVSTLRRASARRITVVIPYYGYARQDRKMAVRSQRIHIILFLFQSLSEKTVCWTNSFFFLLLRPVSLSQQLMLPA